MKCIIHYKNKPGKSIITEICDVIEIEIITSDKNEIHNIKVK